MVPALNTETLEFAPLVCDAMVTAPVEFRETMLAAVLVPSVCCAVVLRKDTTCARVSSLPVALTETPAPEVRPSVWPATLLVTATLPVAEPLLSPLMVMVPSGLAWAALA